MPRLTLAPPPFPKKPLFEALGAEPPQPPAPDLLALLFAAARGEIVSVPVLLRVPAEVTHIVQLPVTGLLAALRSRASSS